MVCNWLTFQSICPDHVHFRRLNMMGPYFSPMNIFNLYLYKHQAGLQAQLNQIQKFVCLLGAAISCI